MVINVAFTENLSYDLYMKDTLIHSETIKEKAAEMLHDYLIPFLISGIIFFFIIGLVISLLGKYILSSKSSPSQIPHPTPTSSKLCTQEAKLCPDGTAVRRTGPNCEFAPCSSPKSSKSPSPTNNLKTYNNSRSCLQDSDCTLFICSGCFNKEWAKTAPPDLPCMAYQGYNCKCSNKICTTVVY